MNYDTWLQAAKELRPRLAERAARIDKEDSFASENYQDLMAGGFFRLAIPSELGGGGASYDETCRSIAELAKGCPATALSFAMHTHLVAANVWKFHHRKPEAEPLLRRIAQQNLILVSTGATDWVASNGSAKRVEGGYVVSAEKRFASGCLAAHVLVTSAAFAEDPDGPSIIHFSTPLKANGTRVLNDWHTLGMRASGSHTVVLDEVFVPEASVVLKRPQGKWHGVWDLVMGVAPAIFIAPYVGLMDTAVQFVLDAQRTRPTADVRQLGELINAQTGAHLAWNDMIRLTKNYEFVPSVEISSAQAVRKSLVTRGVRSALDLAVSISGGRSFYQGSLLERLWRDAQGAQFHPLPENEQLAFSGRQVLGLDPSGA
jgi:alkylation response protein AidB-like acyl-CoA dehydrogenase